MTDNEILSILRDDFREVRSAVVELGREVSGIAGKIDGLCSDVDHHRSLLDKLQEDDATGRIEIEALKRHRTYGGHGNTTGWLRIAMRYAPWLIPVLFSAGVWAGTGGDPEALEAIKDLAVTMEAMAARVDVVESELSIPCDTSTTEAVRTSGHYYAQEEETL